MASRPPNTDELAPDFKLLDSTGTLQLLSVLVAERPLVLVFYRGHW